MRVYWLVLGAGAGAGLLRFKVEGGQVVAWRVGGLGGFGVCVWVPVWGSTCICFWGGGGGVGVVGAVAKIGEWRGGWVHE